MTDEELKSIEQTTALLVENGFVIKDTANFIREVGNGDLEEVINKLGRLQVSINEGVNAEVFSKDIAASLDEIEEVVNNDTYFKTSSEATAFQNLLNDLRDKSSSLFRNTLKAEEILKGREDNLKDIQKRIATLKTDRTIDDVTRTSETIKLSYALNHAKKAKEEALEFYNEQKSLSEKPFKADDIVGYKNELLQAINALDNSFRKLSMEPEAMDRLASLIRDTRDKIVVFGFETQKNQKEFDELCKKYGLEKTDARKIETVKEEKTQEISQPEVEPVLAATIPENKEEHVITNVENLIYEIKRLNPDVQVMSDGVVVDDPSKLVLPEGFKYTEGLGINNKVDDFTPYISAFVKGKEKDNTLDSAKDNTNEVEENKAVEEEKKEEPKKEVSNSRVPSGRLSYTRTRRAKIAPYVKAVLCYGALGGVLTAAAGIGLAPIGTGLIVGAGIGVIGQRIYNKLIDQGKLTISGAQFGVASYELPVVGSDIVEQAKKFKAMIKENRRRKKAEAMERAEAKEEIHEEVREEEPVVETPEVEPEKVETTEEKKSTLYDSFKNYFGASLNSEVDSLDGKKEENVDELKEPEVLNRPEINEITGEEYSLNESYGGR